MSVAIRRDGSVERADVIQSSGIKLLDAAAMRIAKLAEPYPPLPRTEENIDVLHVTRTWNFLPGGELLDERSAPTATSTPRSDEHTSELQSLMRLSYAVFCIQKKHTI